MINFDEAIALIEAEVSSLGTNQVALGDAAGQVLAAPLMARSAAPRVAVSAMDGYAVVDASTRPGQSLRVIGESRAGAGYSGTVGTGEAVRIFTGAPVPDGADRCIVQEHAERDGETVRFTEGYGPGWHVRKAGSDFGAGDVLLAAGEKLGARAMVTAAAADVATLSVYQRPRVAIIGTGDELAPPGEAHLRNDAIPESVTFGVAAMAREFGATIVSRASVTDELPALESAAGAALEMADLVIVTGGASVGERDFAKPMFTPHGLDLRFEKVAIKPGKPGWLGRAGGKWVLGLPGNPTSAMVTARLFLQPLLARLQGRSAHDALQWRRMPLAAPHGTTGNRETFVRARWDLDGLVPLSNQDSGSQSALTHADWLIRCPAGQLARSPGDVVSALLF